MAAGWDAWHKREAEEEAKKAEVADLQQADPDEVRRQAEAAVAAVAAGLPAEARQRLADYLAQIPHAIRRLMVADNSDDADDIGESPAAPVRTLRRPEDLAALLPARMPRFRPGDRPLGIGDWQLVEWLGSGGFGEVWKSENPNLASAHPVALKFCLDPSAAGLQNEAGLLDQVMRHGRHPDGNRADLPAPPVTFGSFQAALLLLLSVPFAFVGGVLALWVRDTHLNVSTGVGFAALFGVSIMNGVLLVRAVTALRQAGMALRTAILQRVQDYLRPILLASLVAILGLLPASLATGLGSDVQRPLATVIVWGSCSSPVLTLFVVPALYYLFAPRTEPNPNRRGTEAAILR